MRERGEVEISVISSVACRLYPLRDGEQAARRCTMADGSLSPREILETL